MRLAILTSLEFNAFLLKQIIQIEKATHLYLPAKSTRFTTEDFVVSSPATFLLFWVKVTPTIVCARLGKEN